LAHVLVMHCCDVPVLLTPAGFTRDPQSQLNAHQSNMQSAMPVQCVSRLLSCCRGAPLSGGWVSQANGHDCVVCPYHGWAFDEEGRLQDVPSLPPSSNGKWPHRPLVESYPVEEKGG
jgi:hypothetical protein